MHTYFIFFIYFLDPHGLFYKLSRKLVITCPWTILAAMPNPEVNEEHSDIWTPRIVGTAPVGTHGVEEHDVKNLVPHLGKKETAYKEQALRF